MATNEANEAAEAMEPPAVPALGAEDERLAVSGDDLQERVLNAYWLLRNRHGMSAWHDLLERYRDRFRDVAQADPLGRHDAAMLLAACLCIADDTRPMQRAMIRYGAQEHQNDEDTVIMAAILAGSLMHCTRSPGLTLHDDGVAVQRVRPTVILVQRGEETYRLDLQRVTDAEIETPGERALAAEVLALLDVTDPMADTCACERCRQRIEAVLPFTCPTCGYTGQPAAVACACYEYACAGGDSRGFGCFHGALTCPQCSDGEAEFDHWALVKRLRALAGPVVAAGAATAAPVAPAPAVVAQPDQH